MPVDYGEIQQRVAFEIMRMMAEFNISLIDLREGQYHFRMESSEYLEGITLAKQKDKF
jgi:hypothetical protein